MRRFIITSPAFTGEINVLYGASPRPSPEEREEMRLQYIDFTKCDLSDDQIKYFKERLPVLYDDKFLEPFGKSKLNVTEEGYRVSFDMFWNRYSLKRNRERCVKIWDKLSEADQVNAYFKLGQYERHLALNTWKTKADPDTYLRNKYWNDDWSK